MPDFEIREPVDRKNDFVILPSGNHPDMKSWLSTLREFWKQAGTKDIILNPSDSPRGRE